MLKRNTVGHFETDIGKGEMSRLIGVSSCRGIFERNFMLGYQKESVLERCPCSGLYDMSVFTISSFLNSVYF